MPLRLGFRHGSFNFIGLHSKIIESFNFIGCHLVHDIGSWLERLSLHRPRFLCSCSRLSSSVVTVKPFSISAMVQTMLMQARHQNSEAVQFLRGTNGRKTFSHWLSVTELCMLGWLICSDFNHYGSHMPKKCESTRLHLTVSFFWSSIDMLWLAIPALCCMVFVTIAFQPIKYGKRLSIECLYMLHWDWSCSHTRLAKVSQ